MSLQLPPLTMNRIGFPRVSGDEPDLNARLARAVMFSPRERG